MSAKVHFFGSRSLTAAHLPVFRALATYATIGGAVYPENFPPQPLTLELLSRLMQLWGESLPSGLEEHHKPLTLLNGDDPPGTTRGAIGADKLAQIACSLEWPRELRRMRWFPVERRDDPTASLGVAMERARQLAAAKPDLAVCVHTDVGSSVASRLLAETLASAKLPFWDVRVTQAGALVSVDLRA